MFSKGWIKYAKIERVCLFSDVIDTYLFKYKSASAKMCAGQLQILYFLGILLNELTKPSIQMPNFLLMGTIWLSLRQHLPIELSLPGFSCSCSHDWKEDASNSEFCMIIKLMHCRLRSQTNQSYQALDADH